MADVRWVLVFDTDETTGAVVEANGTAAVAVPLTQGRPGPPGEDGQSAYELAVAQGFTGTAEQWLDMQRGFLILDDEADPVPDEVLDRTIIWERV